MKELNDIVVEKTAALINDGTLEKMIAANLEKTIASSVEQALRSYSDFGKAITEKIEASIQCAGRDIEIPEYNKFIVQVIEDQFIQVLERDSVEHLQALVAKIIKPVTKEAKISDLLDSVAEAWGDMARAEGNEYIELECSGNDDGTAQYVTFKHPEFDFYSVQATFYSFKNDEKWHIGYINQDGHRLTGRAHKKAACATNTVSDMLYKYYAMGTLFDFDTEIESIWVSD